MAYNKVFSDPIYGFIPIKDRLILDLIEHPFLQRLRRINQLGLTSYVYPGAHHTRFEHVLGCMYLVGNAIEYLREKGVQISEQERLAAMAGALLHDVGHGPYSHTLEHFWFEEINHEDLSLGLIQQLNEEMGNQLEMTLAMFQNTYPRAFFHSLISSQLDMDRLDYIRRDSFYTGVTEGEVNSRRMLQMLNVHQDKLVLNYKGIYSLEKYLVARRLMYWQVYLHKTVLSAEFSLENLMHRVQQLNQSMSEKLSDSLGFFLTQTHHKSDYLSNPQKFNEQYANLDDSDVQHAIKCWQNHSDYVIRELSRRLLNRKLLKVRIYEGDISSDMLSVLRKEYLKNHKISEKQASYLIFARSVQNSAYNDKKNKLRVLHKDGALKDLTIASDTQHIKALSVAVKKHYLFFPNSLEEMVDGYKK